MIATYLPWLLSAVTIYITGMDVISWERNLIPDSDAEGWVDRDGLCADGVFTHWQPLPPPPANPHEGR